MKCPKCGSEYLSKYDICYNCYSELKNQFTQEAIKIHEEYINADPEQWSHCYRLAVDETIRYNNKKEFNFEMVLPYFIEKYVYYKMLEFFAPIHEQNRRNIAMFKKYFMQRLEKFKQDKDN